MKLPISLLLIVVCIFGVQTASAQRVAKKIKRRIIISHCSPWQRPIDLPKPKFPNAAKLVHASGKVSIEVLVNEKGDVEKARAVSGHLLLRTVALEAALKAKLDPSIIGGRAVSCSGLIEYNFVADIQSQSTFVGPKPSPDSLRQSDITTGENRIDFVHGQAINLPKPTFPSFFEGRLEKNPYILVEGVIDENGRVISAKAVSGHPLLRGACEAAARASKFSPTKVAGVPVKARALITYEYILADEITVNVVVNSIEVEH